MPSSSRTIPGTQNQFGIGRAAICVRGQAGTRTNAGQAITPFMFNVTFGFRRNLDVAEEERGGAEAGPAVVIDYQ